MTPRDPYRDEREGARIREERRREEAAEARGFAHTLRRGAWWRVLAWIGVAALAFAASRLRREPSGSPPAPASRRILAPAACSALASDYRARLEPLAACRLDADCVAEARAGAFSALDGCARFLARGVDAGAGDDVASAWLSGGCASSFRTCPPLAAQCAEGRCKELPPEGLPRSWERREIPGLLVFFAPKEIAPAELEGIPEDSWVTEFASSTLRITFDVQKGDSIDTGPPEYTGADVLLAKKNVVIDGAPGLLTRTRDDVGDLISGLQVNGLPLAPEAAPFTGSTTKGAFLSAWARCRGEDGCVLVERIFSTVRRW